MVRYAQKGLDLQGAKEIVDGLIRRRFPFFEDIDGRIYTEIGDSAPDIAVLVLQHVYPGRMNRGELIRSLERHGVSSGTAAVTATRLSRFVDDDGHGNLCLRAAGLRRAEELIGLAVAG